MRRVGRPALARIRPGDTIFAYLSGVQVIAGMFEAVGTAFEDATPLVRGAHHPHRLRVRPIVTVSEEDRVPYAAFHDRLDVAREYDGFRGVVQRVIYLLPKVDEKVLEFLVRARQAADFEKIHAVLDAYQASREADEEPPPVVREEAPAYVPLGDFDRARALDDLLAWIEAQGYVYAPWEVAAYATALRTKPFVILAGVTGTGKSQLPALVAAGAGGVARLVPVRPDWTDPADVLGYIDLQGRFRPGAVLQAARAALSDAHRHHTCLLDEMNLARVEHFFAEVLSRIEDRRPAPGGGFMTAPLLEVGAGDDEGTGLPPYLALVGTVWGRAAAEPPAAARWPVAAWYPRAIRLVGLADLAPGEREALERVVAALEEANAFLAPAQVQAAYRTRDEVALFVLHAAAVAGAFRTRTGDPVDPLDLALHMKLQPRLHGGSRALRRALLGLLGWAATGAAFRDEADASAVLDAWDAAACPGALPDARFPHSAARLCLMWERLLTEGFTSFWV